MDNSILPGEALRTYLRAQYPPDSEEQIKQAAIEIQWAASNGCDHANDRIAAATIYALRGLL